MPGTRSGVRTAPLARLDHLPESFGFRRRIGRDQPQGTEASETTGRGDRVEPMSWLRTLPSGHIQAVYRDREGRQRSRSFTTKRDAREFLAEVDAQLGISPPPRFHDLRHAYATWLADAGVPPHDLAAVLGHSRASTTFAVYTHAESRSHGRIRAALSAEPSAGVADTALHGDLGLGR